MILPWKNYFDLADRHFRSFVLQDDWTEEEYNTFKFLYNLNIPVIGQPFHGYIDEILDERRDKEYFQAHNMDYGDIHDPRRMPSARSSFAAGAFNWASRNLNRLYGGKDR